MEAKLLTSEQVADRLGITTRTLRRLVADGMITYVKVGGRKRFTEASLSLYVMRQTEYCEGELDRVFGDAGMDVTP